MKKIYIIGAGLSGLIAACLIKSHTDADVVILEQGASFESRVNGSCDSLISGVGGAGTLFGGKFCFPPASSAIWGKTFYTPVRFEKFVARCITPFFAQNLVRQDVKRLQLPTEEIEESFFNTQLVLKNDMHTFVLNLKKYLLNLGVIIRVKCRLNHFQRLSDGGFGVFFSSNYGSESVERADMIVIASGRSSFNTIPSWFNNSRIVGMQAPDLGIRLTLDIKNHPMFVVGHDRKLKMKIGAIGVRTFCVCSGGESVLIKNKHLTYHDGHFLNELTNQVNMGILARDSAMSTPNMLDSYCGTMSQYINSNMSVHDFVNFAPRLTTRNMAIAPILYSICKFIRCLVSMGVINRKLNEYPVSLPSVDRINPRIAINENFETPLRNVYVVGDATGISRGFIQSMWSAYCATKHILNKLNAHIIEPKNKKAA